jgi:putative FmdB family regulatory protein
MPIYEYQCEECQSVFEEWQSGFEDREVECPECGGNSKRLISHSSFHLKGGGWYADGYGGKKSGSTPGEAAEPAPAGSTCPAKAQSGEAQSAPPAKAKETSDKSSAGSAS